MKRPILIWAVVTLAVVVSVSAAATSPLLAWRGPVYIVAGFAGVFAMIFLLMQPLFVVGYLPGIPKVRGRRLHHWVGTALLMAVIIHVAGLWITSPPDMIDALLFVSPTPFSHWGVLAMWGVFATAGLALVRRKNLLQPRIWRIAHKSLAVIIVIASVVHAMLIEGTMEMFSKGVLCALVFAATAIAVFDITHRK